MEIISWNFAAFSCISLVIYHLLPQKLKNYWLLGISGYFYLYLSERIFLVLALLVLVNYLLGKWVYQRQNKNLALIPLLMNIGSFFLIKVMSSDFCNTLVNSMNMFNWKVFLPVGFSYYILQLISFQMDVRNGKLAEFPRFQEFALYLFYFPKLLSGPIEKPRPFLAKLANPRVVDNALFARALNMILLGLIRKMFIANILQSFLPDWNNAPESVGWIQAICFVLYVYNDFAGYTLIVCGISNLFGIELSPNFLNPLLSRNFSDFWNRWHITLSSWLRENIYYPVSRKLSRNSGKAFEVFAAFVFPPLLTMLASGFWHKASPALILWGTLLGLFMIFERLLFETWPQLKKGSQSGYGRFVASSIIFLLFSFAMVPLASNSPETSFAVWKNLLSGAGFNISKSVWPVISLGGFSFFLDIMSELKGRQIWWEEMKLVPRSAIVAIGITIVVISLLLSTYFPSRVFIYQGF
jgi:D-alanyl-lipoteichoic acid acyltransferase DltB (MBOAT superfamily)